MAVQTDGTHKARLVGRGDLIKAYVDFDPDAVYCGNVSSCSIKMCVAIAAKYKLEMRGGDLDGAYLVTPISKEYRVFLRTPEGYTIPRGMCMEELGNLYSFPPAGQNFSKEFDKCVTECRFKNTPWDLKFFIKWKNNRPILLIAHRGLRKECSAARQMLHIGRNRLRTFIGTECLAARQVNAQ